MRFMPQKLYWTTRSTLTNFRRSSHEHQQILLFSTLEDWHETVRLDHIYKGKPYISGDKFLIFALEFVVVVGFNISGALLLSLLSLNMLFTHKREFFFSLV